MFVFFLFVLLSVLSTAHPLHLLHIHGAGNRSRRRLILHKNDFSLQNSVFVEYGNLLKSKKAIPTKMLTSGIIGALGDVILQSMIERRRRFDTRRLLVFVLVNVFYIGPVTHFWFKLLEMITARVKSKFMKATVQVVVDQTIGAFVITGGFFAFFEVIDRIVPAKGNLSEADEIRMNNSIFVNIYNTCHLKLMKTLISTWCYWPFLNFINFLGNGIPNIHSFTFTSTFTCFLAIDYQHLNKFLFHLYSNSSEI